jgi:PAS domain S-box-containing protein
MMEQELEQGFDGWIPAAQLAGGIGTFKLDLASNRWESTPQIAVLFGLDPESPRPRFEDWESAIFADDVPKVRSALKAARRDGSYYVELRVRHPDGSIHWLAGRGNVERNASGKPRWLLGSYFEITDRKALESRLLVLNEALEDRVQERARQLHASSERLRESERRFLLLVTAVTDYAIFMLDPEGNIVSWNTGAERIKGYGAEEIVGQHFSRFYTETDQQNGIPERMLAAALQTGKHEAEGWRVRKDGSTFWASVVIEAIRAPTGQLLGFAKVTRDLTEKRHAEAQLRQAQKMEAIGQLTGGIAHDFNNLLMVISGNVETLLRHFPESIDQNLRRSASTALDATGRAAVLTHRLLAFARRQALDPRSLSVNTLISGMSEMLRRTLGESIVIETVLGGGLWPIFVDANQLEGGLLNLAINARDAMPEGGRLIIEAANVYLDDDSAKTAEVSSGQYVGIFVSDTGTGMTPEVISRAFDPFFTTKEIGQGTGLGLSQVYGFVKQSGGHVKIHSEIGLGTTVKIYLPRYSSDEDAADDRPAAVAIPRGAGETVLVAEDHPDVRNFTVEMLRELGYRVLEAMDGHTALRLLDAHREIVLLFTDIGLPRGMNGRQLADEARRRTRGLKVLFTSGYVRNTVVHNGRLDPGVELIVKRFTFATLATRVRRMLDN